MHQFPRESTGLPEARSPESFELADGAHFDLRIAPVVRRLDDPIARLLADNGSTPGPTLRVQQGSKLVVSVVILSRDGVVEPDLVWKDTVLVPTGQAVDILLDVTNPGFNKQIGLGR